MAEQLELATVHVPEEWALAVLADDPQEMHVQLGRTVDVAPLATAVAVAA